MHHNSVSRLRLAVTITVLLIACIAPVDVPAGPVVTSEQVAVGNRPFVTLDKRAPAVPSDGSFSFNATVFVDKPTSYLESRLQIYRPTGRLLYQKTFVRNDVTTDTVSLQYGRDIADLDLDPGAYPLELRVRSDADGIREWTVESELLVYDPDAAAAPVALVARVECVPLTDPDGRFTVNPANADSVRAQVERLAALIIANEELRVTLAAAPLMFEEWLRISQGFELVAPEGVIQIPAEDPTAAKYRETLGLLKSALRTGRLELLNVPFADPDISGLQSAKRIGDLTPQLERGLTAFLSSLQTTPTPMTMLHGGALPSPAAPVLSASGIRAALVDGSSLEVTSTPSGSYSVSGSELTALVTDAQASSTLGSADTSAFMARVFERSVLETTTAPLIAVLSLEAGGGPAVDTLQDCTSQLQDSPWVRFYLVSAVTESSSGEVTLAARAPQTDDTPDDYWPLVAESRAWADGLVAAAGTTDPTALSTTDISLIAESHCWAGPKDTWANADRGRAFASAAYRTAHDILGAASLVTKDITLSSGRGDVPLSIRNDSERGLIMTVRTSSDGLVVRQTDRETVVLTPAENYVTIPVDLRSALSGTLHVELWAGDVLVDDANIRVHASYLDRLAIIGGVVTLLAGILLYVVRRTTRAERTGTIQRKSTSGEQCEGGEPAEHG